jgi:hypothetical protein
MCLQEALVEFQEVHTSFINQLVVIGSRPHMLAHAALTKSSGGLPGLFNSSMITIASYPKPKLAQGRHGV